MAAVHWPEIAGDYNRSCGGDLATVDLATFTNVTYSYFISHPSELRHAVRKGMDEFLDKPIEEIEREQAAEDTREITEQMTDLMDDWAKLEAMMTQNQTAPQAPTE